MIRVLIFLTAIISTSVIQAEYSVSVEDSMWPVVDSEFFTEPETYLLDGTEDCLVVNYTIVKNVPENTQVHVYLLGLSQGEYSVPSGFDIQDSVCVMATKHNVVSAFLEVFGFTEKNCPPPAGVYGTEGYQIPPDTVPENTKPNKYMAVLELIDDEKKILVGKIFVNVKYKD